MSTVEAVYTGGVFRPLAPVTLPENQRVRLTVAPAEAADPTAWLEAARAFQGQITSQRGALPDSTPDIAADRRRHE